MISPVLAAIIALEVIAVVAIAICLMFFEEEFVAFEDKIISKVKQKLKGGTKQ